MVFDALLLFGKMRTVRCPDGQPMQVYRNPDDAYRLEVREQIAHATAEIKALEHAAARAGLNVEQHVRGMYIQLDVANRSMQAQLAAAYKTFVHRPCEKYDWLVQRVEKILDEESVARRLVIEIQAVHTLLAAGAAGAAGAPGVSAAIERAVDRMLMPPAARAALDVLDTVPALSEAWKEPAP